MEQAKKRSIATNLKALAGSSILSRATAFAGMAFVLASANSAMANPTGAQVESGGVTLSNPNANELDINQSTGSAIINWQNFDIMKGETTRFIQPNANAVALNRVVGGQSPSQILGNLIANGHIILVNPNGVFFGAGSRVDAAGLIASTADIKSADFNAGNLSFSQAGRADASIINKGTITAADGGLVALVAPGVENSGVIQANSGTVALAAGSTFTVDMYGDNLYSFAVGKTNSAGKDENGNALANGASNEGTIIAQGGKVLLTANAAKDVVTNVVNNTGVIEASAAHVSGGTVVLDGGSEGNVNVAGTIDASGKGAGQQGGSVTVTGKTITVAKAKIDASGDAAGGAVRIGGDFQGGGTLAHASTTTVDADSTIDVSAANGNAGSTVIWSDDATNFAGSIFASGINGGSAEVSSKNELDYSGVADLHANGGAAGTLLLDPLNITIDGILAAATDIALDLGGNVTISTPTIGAQAGNITVNSAISWFGTGALKLQAANDITVNKNIKSTTTSTGNDGSITLAAGGNVALNNAALSTKTGYVEVDGKNATLNHSSINTISGDITFNNTGVFSDNVANSINNDNGHGGKISINQTSAGSIQNALDAVGTRGWGGETVNLAAGTYNQQVDITKGNTTLTGAGDTTIIKAPLTGLNSYTTASGNVVNSVIYAANSTDVTVKNLKVDANNIATNGIVFSDEGFSHIINTQIANTTSNGIFFDHTGHSDITGNLIHNINGDAIALLDSPNDTVQGNYIGYAQRAGAWGAAGNIDGDGIYANASNNLDVRNNFINQLASPFGDSGSAIHIDNSDAVTVGGALSTDANYIHNAAWDGIKLDGDSDVLVEYNTLQHANRDGIYLGGVNGATVLHNQVYSALDTLQNQGGAIDAVGGSNITVDQNFLVGSVLNTTGTGIHFDGVKGDDNSISSNILYGTPGDAVSASNSQNLTLDGNTIVGAGGNGMTLNNDLDTTVTNNVVAQVKGYGIYGQNLTTDEDNLTTVSNNTIYSTGNAGLYLDTVEGADIEDNLIHDTTGNGISLFNAPDALIAGNYIGYAQLAGSWGAAGNIAGDGIAVDSSDDAVIRNNYIAQTSEPSWDLGAGIHVTNSDGVTIGGGADDNADANHLNNIAWDGIKLGGDSNTLVENNFIEHTGRVAIYGGSVTDSTITGNHITAAMDDLVGVSAITFDGGSDLTVSNNGIYMSTNGGGIRFSGVQGTNSILGNTVNGVSEAGIEGVSTTNLTVSGNTVENGGNDGIYLNGVTNATVNGNGIHDVDGDGVYATNLTVDFNNPSSISGNTIYSVGGNGITLDGVVNAFVTENLIHDVDGDGVFANNLTTSVSGERLIGDDSSEGGSFESYPAGQSIIAGNTIYNATNGIRVTGANNLVVDENLIHDVTAAGIDIFSATTDEDTSTIVATNEIYNTGTFGIKLDTVNNAYVVQNLIHDVDMNRDTTEGGDQGDGENLLLVRTDSENGDGIYATNLTVSGGFDSFKFFTDIVSTPTAGAYAYGRTDSTNYGSEFDGQSGSSVIQSNYIYNVNNDGIHVDTATNAVIDYNTVFSANNDGIFATNLDVQATGDGFFPFAFPFFSTSPNTDVSYNDTHYIGNDGIHLENVTNANVTYNLVHGIGNDGIYGSNLTVSSDLTGFTLGDSSEGGEGDGPSFTPTYSYGQTEISNNTVYYTSTDGIVLSSVANIDLHDNLVHDLIGNGINGFDFYRTGYDSINEDNSTNAGQSNIISNTVYNVGGDGITLDTVENANITYNTVHDLSGNGISGYNLYTQSDAPDFLNYRSYVDHNTIYGIGADGIHVESIQNASVTNNILTNITGNGVFASNPITDTVTGGDSSEGGEVTDLVEVETPGNGSYDNAYFGANQLHGAGLDGIHLEGMDKAEVAWNSLHSATDAAVHVINSFKTYIHDNTLTDSATGINVDQQSDAADVFTNTLTDNGIGVQFADSNLGWVKGNIFTGNVLGINLDNAQTTLVDSNTLNIPDDGVGLRITNGSSGTIVTNTAFNGGNVAIDINGEGSDMVFADNTSTFTGNNFYFVLENGAMFGQTLDASQQTFDGVRGADFTPDQLNTAEVNHTIDVADDATLGDVFYTSFPAPTEPSGVFNQSALDDFQNNRRLAYRRGNFSYAGRTMNFIVDPILPGSLDPRAANLSLLNQASPTAAADVANLFATLAPAAGGNQTPDQLNGLAPAAGGNGNAPQQFASNGGGSCGNSFLGGGFNTGFSCSAQ